MTKNIDDADKLATDERTRADKIGGKIIVCSIVLGIVWWSITSLAPTPEEAREAILVSQPRPGAEVVADGRTCEEDHRACQDEWEFRRESPHYYSGREACKEASVLKAQEHAREGYKGMTGVIRFGPDPFEQLSYIDWSGMMSEDAIIMKDEEMLLQVYGSAWAEGRAICSYDFSTESVKRIAVWFD